MQQIIQFTIKNILVSVIYASISTQASKFQAKGFIQIMMYGFNVIFSSTVFEQVDVGEKKHFW